MYSYIPDVGEQPSLDMAVEQDVQGGGQTGDVACLGVKAKESIEVSLLIHSDLLLLYMYVVAYQLHRLFQYAALVHYTCTHRSRCIYITAVCTNSSSL